jgi:uncharacterized protein (TIGR02246 family)
MSQNTQQRFQPADLKPPFTLETARAKVKAAENAWNTCDPERVARAYSEDSQWRNRGEFFQGRETIKEFLTRKWKREKHYRQPDIRPFRI